MSSTADKRMDTISDTSPIEGDYAVQPLPTDVPVPVDGPIHEAAEVAVELPDASTDSGPSSVSVQPPLGSPFQSPAPVSADDTGESSLEDGEICQDVVESTVDVVEGDLVEQDGSTQAMTEGVNNGDGQAELEVEAAKKAKAPVRVEVEGMESSGKAIDESAALERSGATTAPADETEVQDHTNVAQKSVDAANNADAPVQNAAVTASEDTKVEYPTLPQPAPSVPPHMRPGFQRPEMRSANLGNSQYSVQTNEGPRYNLETPRGPRQHFVPHSHNGYRSDGGREEIARLSAQIMKLRNELDLEREKGAHMRTSVETEKRKELEAALSSMMNDLLRNQADTLAHKAKVEAMGRDLEYRAKRIEQLEVFLTEGQKQLHHKYDEVDAEGRTMIDVIREHEDRQAELKAQKSIADIEGKLAIRSQGFQLREVAQRMREEQYEALMRKAWEAELGEKNTPATNTKLAKVADLEYNNGYGAGKEAGRKEAEEEIRQQGFLEGYAACHRGQVALSNYRQGRIAHDSPELAFLHDPAHPSNPLNIGQKLGELERKKVAEKSKAKLPEPRKVQEDPVVVQRVEEPIRKLPPPRPTFAAELRGAQNMHNGHFVLANGSSSPAARVEVQDVYAGSRLVRYEEEGGNLIDLY